MKYKYKVCVYAISKNEELFVDKWFNSVKDADYIVVLDTGSTDNTVDKLRKHGVYVVEKEINPWRFDVARNESLKLIPSDTDICICIDLDEILLDNWRENLDKIWNNDITRLRYNYNWKLDENNKPLVNFYIEKIHKNGGYKWIHPVHEVLEYDGIEKFCTTDLITVNHYPDNKKSRSNYLPLLELSVKENPKDDRNMHYLGREYMYYGKWNLAIDTLIKHLNLPTATWKDERCASQRFISRCYIALNRYDEARMWLDKAIKEAPYLRDPYVERALLEYKLNNYSDVIKYCKDALKINEHPKTYINETFSFDSTIYDLLSIAYYYLNDLENSNKYIDLALSMSNDDRLKNNKQIIMNKKNKELK